MQWSIEFYNLNHTWRHCYSTLQKLDNLPKRFGYVTILQNKDNFNGNNFRFIYLSSSSF